MKITVEELKSLLSYNPETGEFRWVKPRKGHDPERAAGWLQNGYRQVRIGTKNYKMHRLAWLYFYGRWPVDQVDHIDGNRANNAISNLRDVSNKINSQNLKRAHRDNKCGLLGVSLHGSRWRAKINVDGKAHLIGMFDCQHSAHAAYIAAKKRLHAAALL
jgi:hypothetical protein